MTMHVKETITYLDGEIAHKVAGQYLDEGAKSVSIEVGLTDDGQKQWTVKVFAKDGEKK
jgi:hypothetical protein